MKTVLKSTHFLLTTFYLRERWGAPVRPVALSVVTYSSMFPKELLRYVIMMIVAVFCCIGFGGCAYVSPNPIDQLPDRSGTILSDRLDGETVRNTLGNPLIASRYWGVEVFREATSQIEVPYFFVPLGMIKDDIYRYTLVSYDKDQIAKSTATGIHRRPPQWRIASPIRIENLSIHIQTGDFTFVIEELDRLETLLVSPSRRDDYLQLARSSSQCTAVIGCNSPGCSDTLSVDAGPTLPIPYRTTGVIFDQKELKSSRQGKQNEFERTYDKFRYDTLSALSLAPGTHTLKVSARHLGGEQLINFSCRAGEVLYVVIDLSAKEYSKFWGAKGIEWKIDLHKDMPVFFVDRQLVLYRGDQWFVNPEPMN